MYSWKSEKRIPNDTEMEVFCCSLREVVVEALFRLRGYSRRYRMLWGTDHHHSKYQPYRIQRSTVVHSSEARQVRKDKKQKLNYFFFSQSL